MLIEYNPVIVIIPLNNFGILSLVCNIPVNMPAKKPEINDNIVAKRGLTPITIVETATAPPKVKEPSAERSAKSNVRYEINIPRANKE